MLCSHKDPHYLRKRWVEHCAELLAAADPGKPWPTTGSSIRELRPAAADDEDVPDDLPQLGTVWLADAEGTECDVVKIDIELKNLHGNIADAAVATSAVAFQGAGAAGLERHIDVPRRPLST